MPFNTFPPRSHNIFNLTSADESKPERRLGFPCGKWCKKVAPLFLPESNLLTGLVFLGAGGIPWKLARQRDEHQPREEKGPKRSRETQEIQKGAQSSCCRELEWVAVTGGEKKKRIPGCVPASVLAHSCPVPFPMCRLGSPENNPLSDLGTTLHRKPNCEPLHAPSWPLRIRDVISYHLPIGGAAAPGTYESQIILLN